MMTAHIAPIGEVDRRAAVIVIVGEPIGKGGLRVEVERFRFSACGRDVEREGLERADPHAAAKDAALRGLCKITRVDEVLRARAAAEDAGQFTDVAVGIRVPKAIADA